ncbi:tandem-95 repeat protein [bacterium]|nr:tandem-95 repeat protein [bacterium]
MAKGSCCLTSKKTNSVAAWWPVHWQAAVLFVVLISFSIIQSACDSKAKVQWENLDRSAMQKKLGSTTENAAVGNAYRDLTANLMENERELLNVLVGTVADRNPSKADKGATLIAIFSAVESVRSNSQTRASLPDVLIGLTTIAKPMDLALRRIADGLEGAKSDEKIFYLNNSINLVKALEKNPELFKFVEEITPRVSKENQTLISVLWAALPSDPLAQNKLVTNSYKAASVIGNDDFVRLFRSLQLDNLREFYLDALSNVFVSDSNAPLFVKVLTRIESDSLPNYSTILKEFVKSGVSPAIKNSIVDLLSKSVSLKQELLSSFIALAKDILAQPDASIRLNGMITSVDVLKGEGFYGQLLLTNKFATNKQPLVCQLQGKGTAKVQYSFHWIRNTNPTSPSQADVDDIPWTGLSSSQLSSSLIYDLDQAAQCFARVFVEGAKVIELAGERVTVKSAPPAFASGDKPSVAEVTVVQNKELIYDASGDPASDPNAGDVVVYRINKQPSHGVLVAQSDFLHFNYTPNPSYVGSDEFSYLACDQNGLCSEEKKVSITVQPANHVPVIHGVYGNGVINNTIVLAEDSTLQNVHLLLEDNDSGLEGLACNLPVTVTSTNTGVLADSGITLSGNFPYCSLEITPLQDKNTSFYGAASLRIGIYDVDNAKVFKDIPLVINPSEDPPTLSGYGTTVTTNEDVPFDITFTINDPDGALPCAASRLSYVSSDLNIVASSAVSWSEVSAPNSTSKICKGTFAVLADKNGVVNITLKVTDATNRSAVSSPPIVVTVNSVDDMPVVTNNGTTALAMTQDTSKSITLATATDADGAGHTPQAELITPPAHGSLLCGGSACIANSVLPSPVTYTANAAYTGTDQFTYKMCDPGALMTATTRCSSLISVTITVLGQTPVTTTLGDRTLVLAEDSLPFDIKLDAAVDPDGVLNSQTISYVIQNDTTAGLGTLAAPSLVPTTGFGTVHFTPSANKNGTASFEYKICDSATPVANCAGPFLVQLTLSDVNDVPVKDATVPYSTNLTMTKKYDDESGSTIVSPANIVLPLYSDVDVATNLQHVRPKLVIPPVQGTLSAGLSDSNVVNRVNAADPLQANRTVTYTPNFGYSGKDSLSYQICDYSAANVELSCGELVTVSLTITAVPLEYLPSGWTAPAARTLSLAVLEDVPKSFSFASVRASTVEASQHLSYKIISPALAGDSYVLGKDSGVGNLGRISATLPDVNPGKLAPFVFIPETSEDATGSFQYTICWDAGQTQCLQPVTVNVSVSAQDDAPLVATQGDVSVSVSQDSSKSVVLATGTDVDGAGHTPVAELFVLPTHLRLRQFPI